MRAKTLISRTASGFAVLALTAIAGCGNTSNKERITFEGIQYKTKASPVDKKNAPEEFTVTVKRAVQSLDGAKEAGRYEGTKYCIAQFGTSDIVWISGPDVENNQLTLDGEDLVLRGTCQKRW